MHIVQYLCEVSVSFTRDWHLSDSEIGFPRLTTSLHSDCRFVPDLEDSFQFEELVTHPHHCQRRLLQLPGML